MNISSYYYRILFGAFCILLFLFGLNSWPVADDYCNYVSLLENEGPFRHSNHIFLTWTGRYLTTLILNIVLWVFTLEKVYWVSGVLGVCIAIISYLIASIVSSTKEQTLKLAILILVGIWFGLRTVLAETVFWFTGGLVYALPLILFLIWMKTLFISEKHPNKYFVLMLSIFVGNSIELLVLPVTLMFLTQINPKFFSMRRISKNILVMSIVGALIGAILLFVAPGNFARASYSDSSFTLDLSYLLSTFLRIIKGLVQTGILFYLIMGFFGFLFDHPKSDLKILIANAALFLLLAVASVAPLLMTSDFVAERTYFFSLAFIGIACFFIGNIIKRILEFNFNEYRVHILMVTLASAVFLYSSINESKRAQDINTQISERLTEIQKETGSATKVDCIAGPVPSRLHFNDINSDPEHWINQCVSNYFKIESIQLKDCEK